MKKNLKKILVGLVLVIVLAVIFLRGDQLEELIETIERGAPLFLIGAILFQMGKYSVVEDFSCLNNAVGDIVIGDYCRIGLSNTVIGPIRIDNGVNISQNVALIGLDHNYQNITQGIIEQGITTSPIHIGEHTIIGANVIVQPGITIGKHCFIGAGCVVTQNIPDYCVTVGNPARIIKRYNPQSQTWEKI